MNGKTCAECMGSECAGTQTHTAWCSRRGERCAHSGALLKADVERPAAKAVEQGPGIAAMPRPCVDDGHWVDPYDFLEDA